MSKRNKNWKKCVHSDRYFQRQYCYPWCLGHALSVLKTGQQRPGWTIKFREITCKFIFIFSFKSKSKFNTVQISHMGCMCNLLKVSILSTFEASSLLWCCGHRIPEAGQLAGGLLTAVAAKSDTVQSRRDNIFKSSLRFISHLRSQKPGLQK